MNGLNPKGSFLKDTTQSQSTTRDLMEEEDISILLPTLDMESENAQENFLPDNN